MHRIEQMIATSFDWKFGQTIEKNTAQVKNKFCKMFLWHCKLEIECLEQEPLCCSACALSSGNPAMKRTCLI